MGYPDLTTDESIILSAQNVVVKSVPFEAVLTNHRLILLDTKKNVIAPRVIVLQSIRNVESGENAIRDPIITLTVATATGGQRQMILTFTRRARGERKRECDEWGKKIKEQLEAIPKPEKTFSAGQDKEPQLVTDRPGKSSSAVKKKIEIARPLTKMGDVPPIPLEPVDPSKLPPFGTFCSRCGNRLPPDTTFCNRCGTKIVQPLGQVRVASPMSAPPQKTIEETSSSPQEQKERPIETIIQSIKPLIEDSVPRKAPAPLVARPKFHISTDTDTLPDISGMSAGDSASEKFDKKIDTDVGTLASAALAALKDTSDKFPEKIITSAHVKKMQVVPTGTGFTAPDIPIPPPPPLPDKKAKMGKYIFIGILAVILVIVGGIFISGSYHPTSGEGLPVTSTPAVPSVTIHVIITKTPVPLVTTPPPPLIIPSRTPGSTPIPVPDTGVWLQVSYPGTFSGSFGAPGRQRAIVDSGNQYYRIPIVDEPIIVTIRKGDGSSNELVVHLYKDGITLAEKSTKIPNGEIEIQTDVKLSVTKTMQIPVNSTG